MNSLPSTAAAASHPPRPLPRLGAGNPSTPAQSPAWRFRALACAGLLLALSPAEGATFRWASSSNRIYVENGGTATLSDIKGALPNAPLDLVDPVNGVWLLRASLIVEDGSTLLVHGPSLGGDVGELRLLSRNTSAPNATVYIDADWGFLDFRATKVTSWDDAIGGPDTEHLVHGRAYIRARSRKTGSVITESTLNVVNCNIGHLGYNHREGYGLTWQVVSSVAGVRVFGDVSGSVIHDCQLGVATWANDEVAWSGNEVTACVLYGFKEADSGHQGVLAANDVHDIDYGATFRFSSTNQRIYVTGPGVATLSDIKSALPSVALTLVDPDELVWHLGANIFIENGGRLNLHGSPLGGDVNELRIQSNNSDEPHAFCWISADWGRVDIRSTRITSWDDEEDGPDTEYVMFGRAYIRVRSSLAPDGITARESRMDIIDSDVGYLGYNGSEAYGLVWKVLGTHPDPSRDIFDFVEVYGDIRNSRLHHNYYGMYTFGHYGGQWVDNEVDHNAGYGFDPHDDSDHLLIENNLVHHNGYHGIIASKRCDHLIIRNNITWKNDKNGIMLHRSCNDSVVEGNQTFLNGDSGIALFATSRTLVRNNLILSNSNAGIRFSVGGSDNHIENNDIGYSGKYGFYFYQGSDVPEPGEDGRPDTHLFLNNRVHDVEKETIKVQNADDLVFLNNTFEGEDLLFRFEFARGIRFISNSLPGRIELKLAGSPDFPTLVHFEGVAEAEVRFNNEHVTAVFSDAGGGIFDIEEAAGFTAAANLSTGEGSFVILTPDLIGTSTELVRRGFSAASTGADVFINPGHWEDEPDGVKTWKTQVSSGLEPVEYLFENLLPGGRYLVTGAGMALGSHVAEAAGRLAFSIVPGGPGEFEYALLPE